MVMIPENMDKMWEAWGRTDSLYTAWCSARGENTYRLYVLYALNAHAPVTQREIAEYTGLSKQTVSTVMRALKKEGCVTLGTEGTDRREKQVRLTTEGKELAEKTLAPLYELEARVSAVVGAERMKQMAEAIALYNIVFEKEMEEQANARGRK